jgi:sulfite reductase alpha subunit-like flavoprotein
MAIRYTDSKPSQYVNSNTWDALRRKQNEEANARAEELKKQALTAGNYTGEFADILKKSSEGLADSILNFTSTNPNLSTERPDGLNTFIPDLAKSSPAGLDKLTLTA